MNYEQALEYIHAVSWKGSVPGLERITELMERLGSPEKGLRFIHIVGTNGKGSPAAVLAEAGLDSPFDPATLEKTAEFLREAFGMN